MKIKKEIWIILILLVLAFFIYPDFFLSIIGGYEQDQIIRMQIASTIEYEVVFTASEGIDVLYVPVAIGAITQGLYATGGLSTSLMQVYADGQYIKTINLPVLGAETFTERGGSDANGWANVQNYSTDLNGQKNIRLLFVFTPSKDPMDVKIFLKTITYDPVLPSSPPTTNPPNSFSSLISQLIDFLNQVFATLKALFGLSIVGEQNVNPGSVQTYNIFLNEPYPGSYDYTQGNYTERYCAVALVDNNQNVLSESGFTKCNISYAKNFTATMPTGVFSNYAIVAVMTETRQHYDIATSSWVVDYQNKIIQREALSLTSKVVVPPVSTTAPFSFASIIQAIIDWIRSIFAMFGL